MSLETYTAPVNQLLTYGDRLPNDPADWINYREAGLTENDIPELIRMATDLSFWDLEEEQPEVLAPIHALRALGQLHAEVAIEPLLILFQQQDNDWIIEECLLVYGMFGAAAIPQLSDYLSNPAHGTWPRITSRRLSKGNWTETP
jgi:hypothetical protein